jgi:hypothetical protein
MYKELKLVKNYLEKADTVFSGKQAVKQSSVTLSK